MLARQGGAVLEESRERQKLGFLNLRPGFPIAVYLLGI